VDVGGQPQALALDLGARDALAQARGRDAGPEQVAEDGQHDGARLVEGQRAALRGGHHPEDVVAGIEREHEPRGGRRVERVGHEPRGRLVEDQRPPAGQCEPPRLVLEAQLVEQADGLDVRAGDREAPQQRHIVGVGQVERGDAQAERLAHRSERVLGELAQRAGADERAGDRADGGDGHRRLDRRWVAGLSGHGRRPR